VRKAFIGSFVFHVLIVIGVVQWIAFNQVNWVKRDVYEVRLVGDVSEAHATPAKAEPAPPKPAPVEEKKVEEKKDQMPAPPTEKTKPKPVEKKAKSDTPTTDVRKTSEKPDTSMADHTGEAIPGPKGDTPTMGGVSIDGGDFPFSSYISRMRQKIATTWEVPPGTEGLERSAVVYFRIARDGSVSSVTVEKGSGLQLFDRSCQRAVIEAAPMAPLPREYSDSYIGVHFSFLYQPTE
jgi:TonB family protein